MNNMTLIHRHSAIHLSQTAHHQTDRSTVLATRNYGAAAQR